MSGLTHNVSAQANELLDHIYEYGTNSEGVISRINSLCDAAVEQLRAELAASREREARMRDALDHIARVSMGGRTKSKRNEWIAQRAKSALNGDDDWMRLEKPHGYHRALEGAPVAALAEGAQG